MIGLVMKELYIEVEEIKSMSFEGIQKRIEGEEINKVEIDQVEKVMVMI